ncbi:RCC1 and BTB domain-containing protein 1-like isoform X2 [Planococcus citri]|uniref:RCC1 and BTB domain-containing protein 1-like isoform X2 n=1 Tax=Planococcus citri TaxID=170843 RepID=UPI0031FA42CC
MPDSRIAPQESKKYEHFVGEFFLGDEFFMALTEKGEVFGWSIVFSVPTLIPSLSQVEVIDVACGPNHAIVLCSNHQVYSWRDCSNFPNHTPELVARNGTGITCTASASFYLTEDGEVYGQGTLFYWFDVISEMNISCIGDGNNERFLFVPGYRKIVCLNNIKKIIGGKHHVMALDNDGTVFVWGNNECGQLADQKPYQMSPVKFSSINEKITDIAANSYSDISAAMTVCSRIYAWGGLQGESFFNPILTSFTSFDEVFTNLSCPSLSYGSVTNEKSDRITSIPSTRTLESIFDSQVDSDLTIVIEEKEIFAHKVILKAKSKHFHEMFTNQWKGNDKRVLKIRGYSYDSFRDFLLYLYSGVINITAENIFELMNIAVRYSDETLVELIEKNIENGSISGEEIKVLREIMKLSSSDYEKFCDGMKKMIFSPTSEHLELD